MPFASTRYARGRALALETIRDGRQAANAIDTVLMGSFRRQRRTAPGLARRPGEIVGASGLRLQLLAAHKHPVIGPLGKRQLRT